MPLDPPSGLRSCFSLIPIVVTALEPYESERLGLAVCPVAMDDIARSLQEEQYQIGLQQEATRRARESIAHDLKVRLEGSGSDIRV